MTFYNKKFMSKYEDRTSLSNLYKEMTTECLIAINTPFSLYIHLCLIYGYTEIRSPSVHDYCCAEDYFLDAQAYACVAKNEQLSIRSESDLVSELVESFFETEKHLEQINERFNPLLVKKHPSFVSEVRNCIRQLIGNGPDFKLRDNSLYLGPGSSYSIKGSLVNPFDKLQRHPSISSGALPLFRHIIHNTPIEERWSEPLVINQNFFSYVPKNFKEVRGICIENDGNVPCQKFVGSKLRTSLKRKAYDLDQQHSVHTLAVRFASYSAHREGKLPLATIDLRKASQMIARNVVKELFPPIWYDLMNKTRASKTQIGNLIHENQLFSSMGNGFTFEMETILFLGILMTLPHNEILRKEGDRVVGQISVFGDDIICHNDDVDLLKERLAYFGFRINTNKSYMAADLPFRESCGSDYWDGVDVRPIYLRGNIDENNISTIYGMANQVRRISRRLLGLCPNRSRFARIYSRICKWLPKDLRIFGPHELSIGTDAAGNQPVNVDRETLYEYQFPQGTDLVANRKSGGGALGDLWIEVDEYTYQEKQSVKYLYGYVPVMSIKKFDAISRDHNADVQISYALLGGDPRGATIRGRIVGSKKIKIYLAA